ncbi:MAG: radical SAM protein, partial [Lentisphaeria bacterium]|nr:radical SAM protein [Lentisphaeria bacterium]
MKVLSSILVKPAGPDCNLNCTYCFYLDKAGLFPQTKVHRMTDQVLEELISQTMAQSPQNVYIGWQGGEPTLMGLDFFKKAVEFEKKYGNGKMVGNGFQTNGYLLNEDWADFLAQNNFLIGLSIDGPKHIHDHYRKLVNGKGTWTKIQRNA